jgi:selenocysteine lyase/cysteine desulfurase
MSALADARAAAASLEDYKPQFSRALGANPGRLHFAAHSHHPWPDVTLAAHQRAWELAADRLDGKWEEVFGELVPSVQRGIAAVLSLSTPERIAFAPNTHEFVCRILSCFEPARPVRVLTTDSEFHSFRRQADRLEEEELADITRVPVDPFDSFPERFAMSARAGTYELIYLSQVSFNSGYVVPDLAALVGAIRDAAPFVVIDGYHGFLAVPTDLSSLEDRVFYTSGGYKYAMAGEGACFLHCPDGYGERPRNTGWFSAFGELASPARPGEVPYGTGGWRYWGSTFDPTGLLRLDAVLRWRVENGITVEDVHARVRALQALFLAECEDLGHPEINLESLAPGPEAPDRGHFLTFVTPRAGALHAALLEQGVVTDFRDDRLRFGMGLYHDAGDVEALFARLKKLKKV